MHIICLKPLAPGVYNDHIPDNITAPPDGWAYIPDDFPLPSTFPRLSSIKAEDRTYTYDENGSLIPITQSETGEVPNGVTIMTVTAMTAGTVPEPEPLTPAQLREEAYNTQAIISWNGEMLTVTQAAQQWAYYAAEGDTAKTDELTALISEAKAAIREQYPDEEAN